MVLPGTVGDTSLTPLYILILQINTLIIFISFLPISHASSSICVEPTHRVTLHLPTSTYPVFILSVRIPIADEVFVLLLLISEPPGFAEVDMKGET